MYVVRTVSPFSVLAKQVYDCDVAMKVEKDAHLDPRLEPDAGNPPHVIPSLPVTVYVLVVVVDARSFAETSAGHPRLVGLDLRRRVIE